MAGGPILPASSVPGSSGNIYPGLHIGGTIFQAQNRDEGGRLPGS